MERDGAFPVPGMLRSIFLRREKESEQDDNEKIRVWHHAAASLQSGR